MYWGELTMSISDEKRQPMCTGCGACIQICPFNAISFEFDTYGFCYPKRNENCTECGLCHNVCSIENNSFYSAPLHAYVAVNKNKKDRNKSSSGGIFAALSQCVIDNGGIVYGVTMDEAGWARHIRIDSNQDIHLLQGSKYIQSDTGQTFFDVKNDLRKGHVVLYSGTPCQIAGLRSYLKEENENLYTIDLICHGVSSRKILKHDIENKFSRKKDTKIAIKSFRVKSWNHVTEFCLSIIKDGKKYKIGQKESLWYTAYIEEISLRESCYHCQYAVHERIGDITLGDCRTSTLYFMFHPGAALSTVLINSSKAERLWKLANDYVDYIDMEYGKERKSNLPLNECSKKYYERTEFLRDWLNMSPDDLNIKYHIQKRHRKNVFFEFVPKEIKSIIKGIIYKTCKNKIISRKKN